MKYPLITTPASIHDYISFIAFCRICISQITMRDAENTMPRMREVAPSLKQQFKAIEMQHSSKSNKGWDQL
jgi:hypothetical protein